jgi:hypothetical protein
MEAMQHADHMDPHGDGGMLSDDDEDEPVSAPPSPTQLAGLHFQMCLLAGGGEQMPPGEGDEMPPERRGWASRGASGSRAPPAAQPYGAGPSSSSGPAAGPSGDRLPSAPAAPRLRDAAPSEQQPDQPGGVQAAVSRAADEVLTNSDLLQCVFRFLDVRSRCRACCTASLWQAAASSHELWSEVVLLLQPMTEWQVGGWVGMAHTRTRTQARGHPRVAPSQRRSPAVAHPWHPRACVRPRPTQPAPPPSPPPPLPPRS